MLSFDKTYNSDGSVTCKNIIYNNSPKDDVSLTPARSFDVADKVRETYFTLDEYRIHLASLVNDEIVSDNILAAVDAAAARVLFNDYMGW